MQVITKVLAKGYCSLNEIGLVSCYKGQKRLLERAMQLAAKKYPSIYNSSTIANKESLLGYEYDESYMLDSLVSENEKNIGCIEVLDCEKPLDKDLIIFSAVRSNKEAKLGELNDPRILNS